MRKYKVLLYLVIPVRQLREGGPVTWCEPFWPGDTLFTDGIYMKKE